MFAVWNAVHPSIWEICKSRRKMFIKCDMFSMYSTKNKTWSKRWTYVEFELTLRYPTAYTNNKTLKFLSIGAVALGKFVCVIDCEPFFFFYLFA